MLTACQAVPYCAPTTASGVGDQPNFRYIANHAPTSQESAQEAPSIHGGEECATRRRSVLEAIWPC